MACKSRFVALAAALLVVGAAPAHAAGTEQLTTSWVTVNICNSEQFGVLALLLAANRVRFTAQWLSPDGWVPLVGQATSPWQEAGSAEFTWAQAGWTFNLAVPPTGASYQLRAVAEMDLGSGRTATQTTGACVVGG